MDKKDLDKTHGDKILVNYLGYTTWCDSLEIEGLVGYYALLLAILANSAKSYRSCCSTNLSRFELWLARAVWTFSANYTHDLMFISMRLKFLFLSYDFLLGPTLFFLLFYFFLLLWSLVFHLLCRFEWSCLR